MVLIGVNGPDAGDLVCPLYSATASEYQQPMANKLVVEVRSSSADGVNYHQRSSFVRQYQVDVEYLITTTRAIALGTTICSRRSAR